VKASRLVWRRNCHGQYLTRSRKEDFYNESLTVPNCWALHRAATYLALTRLNRSAAQADEPSLPDQNVKLPIHSRPHFIKRATLPHTIQPQLGQVPASILDILALYDLLCIFCLAGPNPCSLAALIVLIADGPSIYTSTWGAERIGLWMEAF
jgi:hypothetical protein